MARGRRRHLVGLKPQPHTGRIPVRDSTPAATERGRIAKGRVAAIASRLYRSDSPRVLALVCVAPHDVLAAWDAEHEQVRTLEGQRR